MSIVGHNARKVKTTARDNAGSTAVDTLVPGILVTLARDSKLWVTTEVLGSCL